ncbi:MAG TPA: SIMPL domain-containing protein [Candidatus Binataceae bacterium]|nr:SIMPL domain-containing protein [Candidatus Binataceae bacterium]
MKLRVTLIAAVIYGLAALPWLPAYAQETANSAPSTPAPQAAPNAGAAPAIRTIEVRGHGEAHATPDLAFLNLAIETHAVTAEDCANLNANLAQKVVKALEGGLQGKGRVWTGGYSLFPEYGDQSDQKKPVIVGYRAENSITVQTGAIDLLGSLIDTAIAAGANRINFLNFALQDDSRARGEAITKASKDAQAQAQALAAALGVKLLEIVRASTVAEPRPIEPQPRMMAMAASVSMPTPVQPNEITVPATVSLVYQIE